MPIPSSNFNTSHVTVKLIIIQNPNFITIISIHPMLLLNNRRYRRGVSCLWISIHPMLLLNYHIWNISCVQDKISIHPKLLLNLQIKEAEILFPNFNTSHVTVKLNDQILKNPQEANFNTSHVTVKQDGFKVLSTYT